MIVIERNQHYNGREVMFSGGAASLFGKHGRIVQVAEEGVYVRFSGNINSTLCAAAQLTFVPTGEPANANSNINSVSQGSGARNVKPSGRSKLAAKAWAATRGR